MAYAETCFGRVFPSPMKYTFSPMAGFQKRFLPTSEARNRRWEVTAFDSDWSSFSSKPK